MCVSLFSGRGRLYNFLLVLIFEFFLTSCVSIFLCLIGFGLYYIGLVASYCFIG